MTYSQKEESELSLTELPGLLLTTTCKVVLKRKTILLLSTTYFSPFVVNNLVHTQGLLCHQYM